ncbi:unnamed protein product [Owenia fusiformis]|uniref:Netrin receptor UNC5 n=1 Tax=Owenia fusiformis TaxID=6347 RepID=A0A8J1U6Y9_OWEFU|nr:unnamed protein product [Owenia fusiformis]
MNVTNTMSTDGVSVEGNTFHNVNITTNAETGSTMSQIWTTNMPNTTVNVSYYTTTATTTPGPAGDGIKGWQIALIVIAVIVVLIAIVIALIAVFRKSNRRKGWIRTFTRSTVVHARTQSTEVPDIRLSTSLDNLKLQNSEIHDKARPTTTESDDDAFDMCGSRGYIYKNTQIFFDGNSDIQPDRALNDLRKNKAKTVRHEDAAMPIDELRRTFEEMSIEQKTSSYLVTPKFAIGQFDHMGGTLQLPDGTGQLYIPKGALDAPHNIHIYRESEAHSNGIPVFDCGPDGLKFKVPVILRVLCNSLSSQQRNELSTFVQKGNDKDWTNVTVGENMPCFYDEETSTILFFLNHFTRITALSETKLKIPSLDQPNLNEDISVTTAGNDICLGAESMPQAQPISGIFVVATYAGGIDSELHTMSTNIYMIPIENKLTIKDVELEEATFDHFLDGPTLEFPAVYSDGNILLICQNIIDCLLQSSNEKVISIRALQLTNKQRATFFFKQQGNVITPRAEIVAQQNRETLLDIPVNLNIDVVAAQRRLERKYGVGHDNSNDPAKIRAFLKGQIPMVIPRIQSQDSPIEELGACSLPPGQGEWIDNHPVLMRSDLKSEKGAWRSKREATEHNELTATEHDDRDHHGNLIRPNEKKPAQHDDVYKDISGDPTSDELYVGKRKEDNNGNSKWTQIIPEKVGQIRSIVVEESYPRTPCESVCTEPPSSNQSAPRAHQPSTMQLATIVDETKQTQMSSIEDNSRREPKSSSMMSEPASNPIDNNEGSDQQNNNTLELQSLPTN